MTLTIAVIVILFLMVVIGTWIYYSKTIFDKIAIGMLIISKIGLVILTIFWVTNPYYFTQYCDCWTCIRLMEEIVKQKDTINY